MNLFRCEHKCLQYQGVAFKIALPNQWMVMLNGPTLLDDLRRRPEEELSLEEVIEQVCNSTTLRAIDVLTHLQFSQISYTLGRELYVDQFHIDLVREKLTRSLPTILPDVIDELNIAVPTYLPTRDDGPYPLIWPIHRAHSWATHSVDDRQVGQCNTEHRCLHDEQSLRGRAVV